MTLPLPLTTSFFETPPPRPCRYCIAQQKRIDFIDRLVDTSTEIIDSIWTEPAPIKLVSTRAFIQEILRRSKTTYSNLQVCLFYLFRVKKAVLMHLQRPIKDSIISCGRRMFLASLMVAAKFLQDKNYRNRAWSRLSGLALPEINAAEITFLKLINYNLYISKPTFDHWYTLLQSYLYRQPYFYQPLLTIHTCCYYIQDYPSPPPWSGYKRRFDDDNDRDYNKRSCH
ncbi:cyclin-domain-containing protein [Chlamydoabsidia padenii]|nr:cyclin-domain-containing protein [Chlamydoabsidia padenii]